MMNRAVPYGPAHDAPSAKTAEAADLIRSLLTSAPIGLAPMVEAALAWHRLRPKVAGRFSIRCPIQNPENPRYLPIACTHDRHIAERLAHALSIMTWAIITPAAVHLS